MADDLPQRRWFCPTPGWLILALLVVECLLWLSERYHWFPFNEKKGWTVLIAVAVVGTAFLIMLLWFIVALIFRRKFQFSIRSLLILTTAVALPCSWLTVEMKKAREQEAAVDAFVGLGGTAWYDWQVDAGGTYRPNPQPAGPEWLRKLLTGDFFGAVVMLHTSSNEVTDAELARLAGLTQLQKLWLGNNPQITDAGLAHLAGLTQLQVLTLDGTQVTDAGLAHLARLTQLQVLYLGYTEITDAGLVQLERLTQLQSLNLGNTKDITDAGLARLSGLTQLQRLELSKTRITDAGLAHLTGLTQLQVLWLDNTRMTDAGLTHIAGLTQLQELWLNDTQITDAGLAHIAGLTQLHGLDLGGTQVTDEGVKRLQQALPNCNIAH